MLVFFRANICFFSCKLFNIFTPVKSVVHWSHNLFFTVCKFGDFCSVSNIKTSIACCFPMFCLRVFLILRSNKLKRLGTTVLSITVQSTVTSASSVCCTWEKEVQFHHSLWCHVVIVLLHLYRVHLSDKHIRFFCSVLFFCAWLHPLFILTTQFFCWIFQTNSCHCNQKCKMDDFLCSTVFFPPRKYLLHTERLTQIVYLTPLVIWKKEITWFDDSDTVTQASMHCQPQPPVTFQRVQLNQLVKGTLVHKSKWFVKVQLSLFASAKAAHLPRVSVTQFSWPACHS